MIQPKIFADKIMRSANLPGQDITVSTVEMIPDPPPAGPYAGIVYVITATFGANSHTEHHALGGRGGGPMMTAVEMQAWLDGYRQQVADTIAWQMAMVAARALVS